MDKEKWKSKSQMESAKACCQDAAWASYSSGAGEPGAVMEPRAGQDRALPGAMDRFSQGLRSLSWVSIEELMDASTEAPLLFSAFWMIFKISETEIGNIATLMFLCHKYNCCSHHKHATCPGRRENDPCDNKLDHWHFLKASKKRKFKTMEKVTSPKCCYSLFGWMIWKRLSWSQTTHRNLLYLYQQALKANF